LYVPSNHERHHPNPHHSDQVEQRAAARHRARRATIFATRAQRFEQLAEGHSLGDWLRFLGAITRAQHEALQALPALPLPDAAQLALAREHRMPPLPAQSWPRDPAWRQSLLQIIAAVSPAAPEPARNDLARSPPSTPSASRRWPSACCTPNSTATMPPCCPMSPPPCRCCGRPARRASASAKSAALDVPGVCPCCGFLPVASVVRGGGEVGNLRYLHCALCNTEWNLVRVKCTACDATEGVSYRHLEAEGIKGAGAVRAETCDSCKSYLKIVYQEKAPSTRWPTTSPRWRWTSWSTRPATPAAGPTCCWCPGGCGAESRRWRRGFRGALLCVPRSKGRLCPWRAAIPEPNSRIETLSAEFLSTRTNPRRPR
jgi:FdhE protein